MLLSRHIAKYHRLGKRQRNDRKGQHVNSHLTKMGLHKRKIDTDNGTNTFEKATTFNDVMQHISDITYFIYRGLRKARHCGETKQLVFLS